MTTAGLYPAGAHEEKAEAEEGDTDDVVGQLILPSLRSDAADKPCVLAEGVVTADVVPEENTTTSYLVITGEPYQ